MEATPLLRFVYATFTMRCGWEGNANNARRSFSAVANRLTVGENVDEPREAAATRKETLESTSAMIPVSPVTVEDEDEDEEDGLSSWMLALNVAMLAHTDEAAAEIVGSVCKEATAVGAFGDLVAMLITTILDMDDDTSDEQQQGASEVILRMCFERRTKSDDFGDSDIVATQYCETVLEQLVETMCNLLELVGEDEVCAHTGGRLLDRTLHVINDNLRAGRECELIPNGVYGAVARYE